MLPQPVPIELYFSAHELFVEFDDKKQASKGTCFIVGDSNKYFLCTARHVVDPKYRPASDGRRDACAKKIAVSVQTFGRVNEDRLVPKFSNLQIDCEIIKPLFDTQESDIAFFDVSQAILELLQSTNVCTYTFDSLAKIEELQSYSVTTPVVYIGYPSFSPEVGTVTDKQKNIITPLRHPLVRQGIFSTIPEISYSLEGLLGGKAYGLMDSFALNGFSGSPLLIPQDGWPNVEGQNVIYNHYKPLKLAGIVCGHYRSLNDRSQGTHSGLSYFVGSQRILNVLNSIK